MDVFGQPRSNGSAPLEIKTRRDDGRYRVAVSGELDLGTVDLLEDELDRLAPHSVVLDLSRITFIDSMGLTLLVRRAGANVVLETVSGDVDRLIRICGLETSLLQPA
jgi:anti-anti-sigma factor